jgi:hypothetical protein
MLTSAARWSIGSSYALMSVLVSGAGPNPQVLKVRPSRSMSSGHLAFDGFGSGGCRLWSSEESHRLADDVYGEDGFALIVSVLTASDAAFDGDQVAFVGVLGDVFCEFSEGRDLEKIGGVVVSVDGEGKVRSGFVAGVGEPGWFGKSAY